MAYRAFVSWMMQGKRLGKGVRVVIPACVVSCIRNRFPSPDGQYTGFEHSSNFVWTQQLALFRAPPSCRRKHKLFAKTCTITIL